MRIGVRWCDRPCDLSRDLAGRKLARARLFLFFRAALAEMRWSAWFCVIPPRSVDARIRATSSSLPDDEESCLIDDATPSLCDDSFATNDACGVHGWFSNRLSEQPRLERSQSRQFGTICVMPPARLGYVNNFNAAINLYARAAVSSTCTYVGACERG